MTAVNDAPVNTAPPALPPASPPTPPPAPPATDLFAQSMGPGTPVQVKVFGADASLRFTLQPFGGFAGGATVSTGDVNGDGVQDVVVGAGAGTRVAT